MKTLEIPCVGYSVVADWYEGKSTDKILLSLIGWQSSRKKYDDILSAIVGQTGMSALVFDYSGHGDSPFKAEDTRPAQHFLEVICVFDWLKAQYPDAEISVMGSSFGSFLGVQLTKYREFANLILRAPSIYRPQDFYNLAPYVHQTPATIAFRTDKEALAKHPLLARASEFKGKTLVAAHENDEYIPQDVIDAYVGVFNAELYVAKGFPHSIADQPKEQKEAYQKVIANWLKGNS